MVYLKQTGGSHETCTEHRSSRIPRQPIHLGCEHRRRPRKRGLRGYTYLPCRRNQVDGRESTRPRGSIQTTRLFLFKELKIRRGRPNGSPLRNLTPKAEITWRSRGLADYWDGILCLFQESSRFSPPLHRLTDDPMGRVQALAQAWESIRAGS